MMHLVAHLSSVHCRRLLNSDPKLEIESFQQHEPDDIIGVTSSDTSQRHCSRICAVIL